MTNNLNQGASEAELLQALRWALEWIDAVPSDTPLPTMPGFDRDYVNELIDRARRTPAATTGAELPPLPWGDDFEAWLEPRRQKDVAAAFHDYARAAIEADRAQRQAAPASTQPADSTTTGCSKCGSVGIHACLGAAIPDWTPEAIADFGRVLDEYETDGAQPDQRDSAAVPRVPTSEMIRAGMPHFHDKGNPATKAWHCYKDMVAAAPAAQPVAKDERK